MRYETSSSHGYKLLKNKYSLACPILPERVAGQVPVLRLVVGHTREYSEATELADYTGVTGSIFGEPEYRDKTDLIVAFYLILNSDMIGVCPIRPSTVAALCRTSPPKLIEVLEYFAKCGKLTLSIGRQGGYPTHAWWRSKLWHTLYKGKGSPKQTLHATTLIGKWEEAGVFGKGWASGLSQLYGNKYNLVIPFPTRSGTHSDESYSYIQSKSETEAVAEAEVTAAEKIRAGRIKEKIQFSEFAIAVGHQLPDPNGWVLRMVKHFKPPEFMEDQIQRGLDSMFEYYKAKGLPVPVRNNIREKIWQWIERQVDNTKKPKMDEYDRLCEEKYAKEAQSEKDI